MINMVTTIMEQEGSILSFCYGYIVFICDIENEENIARETISIAIQIET